MFDWIRYILYTGADEHEDQPVQNKTTGSHLHQCSSSWTTAPAAAVPAQGTGIQPCTLQLRSLWFNPSPKADPTACLTAAKERRHPHQPQLQRKSSSDPVQLLISKQQLTEHNSQILREGDVLVLNFAHCSHHVSARKKVFLIDCREPRMIRDNVLFPLFYKGQ